MQDTKNLGCAIIFRIAVFANTNRNPNNEVTREIFQRYDNG